MDLKTPEEIAKEVMEVTSDDIQKLAQELFTDERLNLAIIGEHKNDEELKEMLSFK